MCRALANSATQERERTGNAEDMPSPHLFPCPFLPRPVLHHPILSTTPHQVPQLDDFAQGAGLIDAPAAIAYALEHHGKPAQDLA